MFRRKRSDTKVGSIERKYGVDFGVRSDMKLGRLLHETGAASLGELIRTQRTSWQHAERRACERRGIPHVGGPGAPDCDDGDRVVEVKHQQQPVSASQVRQVSEKSWAQVPTVEMVSSSGFTDGARREARRRGVQLRRR